MVLGGIIGGIGNIAGGIIGKGAADKAADAQRAASDAAINEQRIQRKEAERLFNPYVSAGEDALEVQRSFLGLGDPEAYQGQIDSVLNSPEYSELISSGEEAILQNAAATGGLRGGNVKSTLAEFRPSILGQLLNQRYNRLTGLTTLGQNSVINQTSQGQQTANQIGNNLNNIGAASANSYLAQGRAAGQTLQGGIQLGSSLAAAFAGGFGGGGGAGSALSSAQGASMGHSIGQQFGVGGGGSAWSM